jgi:hypothetical protein
MPGFDRTGPEGRGPMTGGGRGWCHPATGYGPTRFPYAGAAQGSDGMPPAAPVPGRPRWGMGRGFRGYGRHGRGRGRGR